jgi:pyridoxal phosphate enzyme (YggS family)
LRYNIFSGRMMEGNRYQSIPSKVQEVQNQIAEAATSAGRDPAQVKLVVVTKGHPLEAVQAALQAGLRTFGENYAQEGLSKMLACSEWSGVEWHMIGHIQSRKADIVAEHYDWVHSLDSLKLARRLDRFAGQTERQLPTLLEFNVSGEESKYGWPAWDEDNWTALAEKIAPIMEMPNLSVRGLMTMAPFLPNAEETRPYFKRLRRLRDHLAEQFPQTNWSDLSMGMSDDFQVAIQEGATIVRIGTAILGSRP